MSDKNPIESWLQKLLSRAFLLFATALLLHWAWALLLPLVPIILVTTALLLAGVAVVRLLIHREQRW